MSRDAKVGLVIIFSFVFLLGTILLHRFQLTGGDDSNAIKEPVVSESDSENGVADAGSRFPGADERIHASTVDAVPTEPIPGRKPDLAQPRDPGFGDSQKIRRTPNLSRPPAELPASHSSGATIALTDAEDYQQSANEQPAAIVESNSSLRQRQTRHGSGIAADNVTTREQEADASSAVASANDTATDGTVDGKAESAENAATMNTNDQVAESRDGITGSTLDESMSDSSENLDQSSQSAQASTRRLQQAPFDVDDSQRIQQTEGMGKSGHRFDSPPSLPKYGESPQATIESVPPRMGRVDQNLDHLVGGDPTRSNRALPQEFDGVGESEASTGTPSKTYVVKDGDSFWTISAKHYGTGKYFRALEDHNRQRLAAYEDGRRILRPGTEIMLPSLAILRSKNSGPKPPASNTAAGKSEKPVVDRDRFRSPPRSIEDSYDPDLQNALSSRSSNIARNRGSPRTYRVQEGDSLSKIAQRELGATKRWQEIYELNAEKLEGHDFLKIGMELRLPDDRPVEKLVDRAPNGR